MGEGSPVKKLWPGVLECTTKNCSPQEEARRSNIRSFSSNSLILCWCCPWAKHNQKSEDKGAWTVQAIEVTLQSTEQAEERAEMSLEEDYPVQFPSKGT